MFTVIEVFLRKIFDIVYVQMFGYKVCIRNVVFLFLLFML